MHSWRDHILKEFAPEVSRLTLVADPDGLLLEEGILEGIRERGFELIPFEDHIAFRYAYESKFRTRWDRGEHTDLVVVLRSQASDLAGLPFDLLQAGRKLSFNLGDIFPSLSYPVVTLLERADLDALYEAQRRYAPGPLGDNATKEFALRHVFEIAPELIKQPSDLLRVLIRRHYLAQRVPAVLDERLIQLLGSTQQFREWPLEVLVTDREAFFTFLQERWTIFLDQESNSDTTIVREDAEHYGLTVSGPVDLPFGHHDIRIYIDNLFAEGLLQPISHGHAAELSKTWMGIGVQTTPIEDVSRRLDKLIANLQLAIPTADARHTEWLHFARGWAELILLKCKQSDGIEDALSERIRSLREQVDVSFSVWLAKRYAGLVNLPPVPPVMLHHLPRFLARELSEQRKSKIALLVMDGLAYDQWLLVRDVLSAKHPTLCFREQAVFAWVPSITSVSRQATFAGKPPAFFPNSIQTTDKEPTLWSQFWADQGYSPSEVFYIKGLGDGTLDHVSEALSHPKVRIAGMVVDKVDKIMHGMELGTAGMHNQVAQWASLPYLSALIDLLLENGFRVYLTSDHGNVEAEGCGRPAEGALADLRGERVRVFPNEALRAQVLSQFPGATAWFPIGLPDNYLPLIAPARAAFIQEKRTTVSHGGFSIEELVVPLVQIEERTQ
jgi:hypothetical protein